MISVLNKGWGLVLKEKFFKSKKVSREEEPIWFGENRLETKILSILLGFADKYENLEEHTFTQILEGCELENAKDWKRVKAVLDAMESVGLIECKRKTYIIYVDPEPKKVEETHYKLSQSGFVFATIVVGFPEKFPFIDYKFIIKKIQVVSEKGV